MPIVASDTGKEVWSVGGVEVWGGLFGGPDLGISVVASDTGEAVQGVKGVEVWVWKGKKSWGGEG